MIDWLRTRIRQWRERRDPALFVRRLVQEGVISEELLRHVKKHAKNGKG